MRRIYDSEDTSPARLGTESGERNDLPRPVDKVRQVEHAGSGRDGFQVRANKGLFVVGGKG